MRCETWASPSADSAGPCSGRHVVAFGIVRGFAARRWSHRIVRARSVACRRVPESPYARDRPRLALSARSRLFVPLYAYPWTQAGTACPGAGTGAGTLAGSSVEGPKTA